MQVAEVCRKQLEDTQIPMLLTDKKKSPRESYFWTEMDGEAPTQPREHTVLVFQVINQGTGWKMPLLLILCLLQGSSLAFLPSGPRVKWLQAGSPPSETHLCAMETFVSSSPLRWQKNSFAAANALKGPRLVSGAPGGAVTIQCHYPPSSVNRHQRKYWCRLGPPMWICQTIVSSNHYTHRAYLGRVSLADFPQSGLLVVRLSQLSLDDVGCYRCGIGDENNRLFFSMNLTISADPSSAVPTATSVFTELLTASCRTASPAASRWTLGTTQTLEKQRTEWETVVPTTGTSKATVSAKGRQSPGTARASALETDGRAEATIPTPEKTASKLRSASNATEGIWAWGTRSPVTNMARVSEGEREMATTELDRPEERSERVKIDLDAARKTRATTRSSAQVSEQVTWETLREATLVSKQQAPGSAEGAAPAADSWTISITSTETASVKGFTDGDLDSTVGDRGPQTKPSQVPVAGSLRTPGKESSVKRDFPEEESSSWMLTPVSIVLAPFLIAAVVLWQRRLRRKRASWKAERKVTLIQMTCFLEQNLQPEQLPHMERMMLQGDSPTPAIPAGQQRDLGSSGLSR